MGVKDLVQELADLIWRREVEGRPPMESAILGYLQDAVAAELEYRRRMRELDGRLAELESGSVVSVPS
jgi:hypothetical protein